MEKKLVLKAGLPKKVKKAFRKRAYGSYVITFNTEKEKPENYAKFQEMGFDIFDEVEVESETPENPDADPNGSEGDVEGTEEGDDESEPAGYTKEELEAFTLSELRELFPDIKATSKVDFIAKVLA